ncbi:MAG: NAD(P)-binding protein [Thaumarchaeota archaeon]|nr:NAD(P)-binding protein [Candidatus Calditenuaceae archaeon]MDW8042024.1 NAD(P)-binding protein [Nitrososphaerota archaeon]
MSSCDVLVIGSDLAASVLAHLLSVKGYRVVILEQGRRLGGPHPYLTLLESTLRPVRLPFGKAIGRFVRMKLHVRLGEKSLMHGGGDRLAPLDVRRACESLITDGTSVFFNARYKLDRSTDGEVRFSVESIDGKLEGTASVVVRSVPMKPVRFAEVELVCGNELLEGALRVSGSGVAVTVPLSDRSYLHVGTHRSGQQTLARSTLSMDSSSDDVLTFPIGEAAGEVMPPWSGDYAIESAVVASRVVEASTSGDGGSGEAVLLEHRMRSEMRLGVLRRITSGGAWDLDLNELLEALSPQAIQL